MGRKPLKRLKRIKKRLRGERLVWACASILLSMLILTVGLLWGNGEAYASGPAVLASCGSGGAGNQNTQSCSYTLTSTELMIVACIYVAGGGLLYPTVTSGTATLSGIGIEGVATGHYPMVEDYIYGATGAVTVSCTNITASAGIIGVVFSGLTPGEIDLETGSSVLQNNTTASYGYDANYASAYSLTFWDDNASMTACPVTGWTVIGDGTGSSDWADCYGPTTSTETGGYYVTGATVTSAAAITSYASITLDFSVTLSGGIPSPTTTTAPATTTTAPATTTTACTTVDNKTYCSGVPPTTIGGQSCAWNPGEDAYVCPSGTVTTTLACQTVNSIVYCSGVPPTTIGGQSCAFSTGLGGYVCPTTTTTAPAPTTTTTICQGGSTGGCSGASGETVSSSCSFWDPVCWLAYLFIPSSGDIASLKTAAGTSGLNTTAGDFNTAGSTLLSFVAPGVAGGDGIYGGFDGELDCVADTGVSPVTFAGGFQWNDFTGQNEDGVHSGFGGPADLCWYQNQMGHIFVGTTLGSNPIMLLKDLIEAGLVLATVIAAFQIINRAFASGK